ncbi:hypothetical protein FNV43_RR13717 [Rhamnella rubrinervis]|uniref:Uncharacterized protein n=1 Tax=Rhamnella rubrinervis TaxID=2594499 RepID=A0A8K0H1N0_9ROSA|nr:hypothetical protein FNV43_RR13717 [Rhamnella rubrinervis]
MMKIGIIKRETIKPSISSSQTVKAQRLKKSFSEALTLCYPFSGRIENNITIRFDDGGDDEDCGAYYIEARIDTPLSSFLQQPDVEVLKKFLPNEVESPKATTMPLLLLQISFFNCGGLAVGLCISHRLADLVTLIKFIMLWKAIAHDTEQQRLPLFAFDAASYFPPKDQDHDHNLAADEKPPPVVLNWPDKCVTKRFVFDGSQVAALKAKAASEYAQRPSRVEAVSALIWRCAWRSNTMINLKHSVMVQFMDIRKRVESPPLENTMGNLVHYFGTVAEEGNEMELPYLVAQLREQIRKCSENLVKTLASGTSTNSVELLRAQETAGDFASRIKYMKLYLCSSWCNFRLYDYADFGWGKPIWIFTAGSSKKNFFRLMETKEGDGVEAWVSLSNEEMALFERDDQLLAFASSNPSVL